MDRPTYGPDVLLATLRQHCARGRQTPLQVAGLVSSVALELARSEGRETLEVFLEIQAARVAREFAQLTDWQERRTG